MKKILAAVVGVLVLLLIAILVIPQFIDWNRYKDDIAAEAERLTGREVTIGGDIDFSVLPAPALVVNDLSLANIPGGVATDMARLEKAEVHVALLPLLSGRIDVTQVTLVEPVVALEVLPDGRTNWTFEPAAPSPPEGVASDEEARQDGAPDVRLNEVEIENGTISYRDVGTGTLRRVEQVDATIEAKSLQGPVASAGSFRIEGVPVSFELDLGRFANADAVPVSLILTTTAGDVRATLRGTAAGLEADPRFEGRFEAQAGNLAGAVQTLAREALPGFLAQRAALAFDLDASTQHASINALELRLGDATADGAATVELGAEPSLAAQFAAGTVDLDAWLAMEDVAPPPPAAEQARPEEAGEEAGGEEDAEEVTVADQESDGNDEPPAFQLPRGVTAVVTVAVEAITFNDGVIRQLRADTELADGRMTLSRLSALLPGGAEAAMSGALTATEGEPLFEGHLDARAADLRTVLRWLDADVAAIPAGRLRTLELSSEIAATPQRVQARNLEMHIDNSTISGEIEARLTEVPAYTVDFAVDHLNLSAYLPEIPAAGATAAPGDAPPPAVVEAPPAADTGPPGPLKADIAVRVGTLTYNGVPASDVVVDGRLDAGVLTLARASVGDFAGATATASGVVKGLPERPLMENVAVDVTVPDPARLLRGLDLEAPAQVQALGAISGSGRLSGAVEAPAVDLRVQAAGADVTLAGVLNPAPGVVYDGRFALAAAEPSRLLSVVAPDYRPAGPLGPIDLAAGLAVREDVIAMTDLSGQLAGMPVSGLITVNTAGPRPHVTADLATGRLVLDPWLPAEQSATAPVLILPAAWVPPPPPVSPGRRPEVIAIAAGGVDSRWSREPIDLGTLRAIDADIKLRSEAIVYQGHALDNAELTAALAGGVLAVNPLRGTLYGGPLAADGRMDATGVPAVTLSVNVEGADLGRAPAAPEGVAGGRVDADARLATQGRSIADFVSALAGEGSLVVRNLDPALDASGLPVLGPVLGPTLQLVGAINTTLGPLLGIGTGRTGPGLADISAPFTIDQGVARFDPIRLDTPIYTAAARGTADLAAWHIDVTGEMTLAQNVLGSLLESVREVPSRCTFGAEGPLDKPNVQIGANCLPQGITIPGTGEKGLSGVLEKLIPKEILPHTEEPPASASEEPAPEQPPEPAPQPEKVIRDLLEGFIRR